MLFRSYPNPSDGMFSIELEQSTVVTINDILGRTIIHQRLDAGRSIVNLEKENSGIYFLSINDDLGKSVYKIILSH